jgi:hypothetical protein
MRFVDAMSALVTAVAPAHPAASDCATTKWSPPDCGTTFGQEPELEYRSQYNMRPPCSNRARAAARNQPGGDAAGH